MEYRSRRRCSLILELERRSELSALNLLSNNHLLFPGVSGGDSSGVGGAELSEVVEVTVVVTAALEERGVLVLVGDWVDAPRKSERRSQEEPKLSNQTTVPGSGKGCQDSE